MPKTIAHRPNRLARRPLLEGLEHREMLSLVSGTTFTWNGGTGAWNDPSNWTKGPGPSMNDFPADLTDSAVINSGHVTLNTDGIDVNQLVLSAGATLTIAASRTLIATNFTSVSGGNLGGGTLILSGTLQYNNPSSPITTNSTSVTLNGPGSGLVNVATNALSTLAINNGSLTIQGGHVLTLSGNLANNLTITVTGAGSQLKSPAGNLSTVGQVSALGGGLLDFNVYTQNFLSSPSVTTLSSGGEIDATTIINGGNLDGSGTIDGSLNLGTSMTTASLRPGGFGGIGQIHVTGNLALGSNAKFEADFTSASSFDSVTVGGTASLDGQLVLSTFGGFVPSPSNTFQILTSTGARTGSFASTIGTIGGVAYSAVYASNSVVLATVYDATSNVSIERSGYSYIRSTRRFRQQVTVTNTSSSILYGPISVALDGLTLGVDLWNRTGTISNPSFTPFSPYINIPSISSLAPGQSATVILEFDNPSLLAINYTTRILTGPGAR